MIFRKWYTVRKFTKQSFVNGYATQGYSDSKAELDVQPEGNTLQYPAEGGNAVTRLSVWGDYPFTAANQDSGVKGDRLLWYGHWYECTSSVWWDGTPLHHYKSSFTYVPNGGEE